MPSEVQPLWGSVRNLVGEFQIPNLPESQSPRFLVINLSVVVLIFYKSFEVQPLWSLIRNLVKLYLVPLVQLHSNFTQLLCVVIKHSLDVFNFFITHNTFQ